MLTINATEAGAGGTQCNLSSFTFKKISQLKKNLKIAMMIRMWGTLRPLSPLPPSQKDRGSSCPTAAVGKPQMLLPTCAVFIRHQRPALPPGGENQPSSPSGQDEGDRGFLAPLPLEQIPGLSHIQAAAKGGGGNM